MWLLMVALVMMAKSYTVTSPNGQLTAQVEVGTVIKYSLKDANQQLVLPSAIALKTDRGTWGENSHLRRAVKTTHRGQIAAFAYKRNEVSDCYNQLRLQFKEGFDLIFRLYDEGMAYRFASTLKSEVTINDEQAQMRFARDWKAQIPYVRDSGDREDQLHNSFENNYTHTALSQLMDTRLIFTPLIVEADKGVRLCVAESDVEHYPGLFWLGNGKTPELTGVCAPYPSGIKIGGYRLLEQLPTGRENYLVKAHAAAVPLAHHLLCHCRRAVARQRHGIPPRLTLSPRRHLMDTPRQGGLGLVERLGSVQGRLPGRYQHRNL